MLESQSVKLCVVVQGNVRKGTSQCVNSFINKGFHVILSCWESCKIGFQVESKRITVIKNKLPALKGYNNRNLLRLSTYNGILEAKNLGFEMTLKWRTDIAPGTNLLNSLLNNKWDHLINNNKIVIPNYRCFKFYPRFYSSINDMIQMGQTNELLSLWDINGIDLSKEYNGPNILDEWPIDMIKSMYCNEAELLALYVAKKAGLEINDIVALDRKKFDEIFNRHILLEDYNEFGLKWIDEDGLDRQLITTKDRGIICNHDYLQAPCVTRYSGINIVDRIIMRTRRNWRLIISKVWD